MIGIRFTVTEKENKMGIAFSLSGVVYQIAQGNISIDNVDYVVSGTYHDLRGGTWDEFFEEYFRNLNERQIAQQLLDAGKIVEPRRFNLPAPAPGAYEHGEYLLPDDTKYWTYDEFGGKHEASIAEVLDAQAAAEAEEG